MAEWILIATGFEVAILVGTGMCPITPAIATILLVHAWLSAALLLARGNMWMRCATRLYEQEHKDE